MIATYKTEIYIEPGMYDTFAGGVYFEVNNDDDYACFRDVKLPDGLETSNGGKLASFDLIGCEVMHEGITGGNAAQRVNAIRCYTVSGDTISPLDDNDIAGTHTKNVVKDSSDHVQGTDQKLDDGGQNECSAADLKSAVDLKHSNSLDHSNAADHARSHALDSSSDHTINGLTGTYLIKSNGSTLAPATNTDSQVSDAVSKAHSNSLDHSNSRDHSNANDPTANEKAGLGANSPSATNGVITALNLFRQDVRGAVKPAIKLTHAADPTGGGDDNPLKISEGYLAVNNQGVLGSNCKGAVDCKLETANGSVNGVASSASGWVVHSATPPGVKVYVNEASSNRLEFVSGSAKNSFIVLNFGTVAPFLVRVIVHHSATAATGKPLYFNDDGGADAQLVYTATGAADTAIPAGDVAVLEPAFI